MRRGFTSSHLISTDRRVGELTRLNISDLNLQDISCIVLEKENSEREVYFYAKSKMYIEKYIETRTYKNRYQNNVKNSHRKYIT